MHHAAVSVGRMLPPLYHVSYISRWTDEHGNEHTETTYYGHGGNPMAMSYRAAIDRAASLEHYGLRPVIQEAVIVKQHNM